MENNYGEIDADFEKETHGNPELPSFLYFKSSVIELGFTEAIIYGILCAYAKGKLGYCNLRNQTIGEMLNRSTRVVSDAISKLDKNGFIKVHLNVSKKGTYRTITISGLLIEENSVGGSEKLLPGTKNTSIQKNYKDNSKENKWESDCPLKSYILAKDFNLVIKLKPPSVDNCNTLIKTIVDVGLTEDKAKIEVVRVIESMENYKPLTKNNVSFYLTALKWIKSDIEKGIIKKPERKFSQIQGVI